jgi:hypothetical protein
MFRVILVISIFISIYKWSFSRSVGTWSEQTSGTSEDLCDVYFVDQNNGWAVGDNGIIININTLVICFTQFLIIEYKCKDHL